MVWCFDDPYLIYRNFCFYYRIHFCSSVDIVGIREPVYGSLLYVNNIISGAIIHNSAAIGLHF
jgi:photosystem II P680 reaction center D1 protein